MLQCLSAGVRTPGVGRDRLRCHQGAATSPWPQQGDRKDTEYTEEANFSGEFNLSS